ncbi:ngd5/osm-6/ift52, putative [Perkinsus marinus ATCC 50983]|uniref:Ngd5/osm-6/ift52, putative n=1 Tax=Perkinsus marinus (strain ATCC 50983 / TXsc) TaxID=423536 RepID=C5LL16_PERM5|nr:ngd5/osm-6/ift52, putative [Perkinsus marinus ATCC 50983]EER02580.1 ngd5/osm-6/ift52, putative [Perkinsus marinus ATCC 50983]|eukprot:XP_002769862.1 ngd5/osm-6/ift52, putative [Perkinsus marinus ATCC 50983]
MLLDGDDDDDVIIKLLFGKSNEGAISSSKGRMRQLRDMLIRDKGWIVKDDNTNIITYDYTLKGSNLVIIIDPQHEFDINEIYAIERYIDIDGGAVLILCNEGGLVSSNDNINNILQVYGISINNDSLIRSAHHPNYHHPKEVSTRVLFSSGLLSYPIDKPLCVLTTTTTTTTADTSSNGIICVLGSCMIFNDDYISKEDNRLLAVNMIRYLAVGHKEEETNDVRDKLPIVLEVYGKVMTSDGSHKGSQYNKDNNWMQQHGSSSSNSR